jgi:hypothetical protein
MSSFEFGIAAHNPATVGAGYGSGYIGAQIKKSLCFGIAALDFQLVIMNFLYA